MRKQIDKINLDNPSFYNFNELTLQNLLNQFFDSIETCKENTDKTLQFYEWVKTQGLKEEVNKQVEELYNNGKLTELINKLANNIDNTIKVFKNEVNSSLEQKAKQVDLVVERERINNIVAIKDSVDNLETADIRVGFDGKTYTSAGEAVREQFKYCENNLTTINDEIYWELGTNQVFTSLGKSTISTTLSARNEPFKGYRVAFKKRVDKIRKVSISFYSPNSKKVTCEILDKNLGILATKTVDLIGNTEEQVVDFIFDYDITFSEDYGFLQVYSESILSYTDITDLKNSDLICTYVSGNLLGAFYDGSTWTNMTVAQSDKFAINFELFSCKEDKIRKSKTTEILNNIEAIKTEILEIKGGNELKVKSAQELILALEYASLNATRDNWVSIYLDKGTYDLLPFIDLDSIIKVTATGYRGIEVPQYTKLIGDINRGSIIEVNLPTTATTEQMWTVSPLNAKNHCHLYNLVIKGKNIRYAFHDDGGSVSFDRYVENCEFIHEKNEGSIAWAQQDAYGMGTYKGSTITFKDCDFKAYGYAFYLHDNPNYNLPSNVRMINCRFESGEQRPNNSMKFQGMGASAMTNVTMKNCSVNKEILLENTATISMEVKKYNTNIEV